MIVKLVPNSFIQYHCSVMTSLQLSKVVTNCKKVINWFLCVLAYHKVRHIKPLNWKVHMCILLSIIATEPFQIYQQNWWHIINLYFFHCLFMRNAFVTVPRIGLRQILRLVELSETVLDTNILSCFVDITCTSKLWVFILCCSIQSAVQCPTTLWIELNCYFKFWTLWKLQILGIWTISIYLLTGLFTLRFLRLFYLVKLRLLLL